MRNKYLWQWAFLNVLLAVIMAVYGFNHVVSIIRGDDTNITLGMFIFGAAIWAFSFKNILWISRELDIVGRVSEGLNKKGKGFPKELREENLIGRHFRNIRKIFDTQQGKRGVDQGRLIDVIGGELDARDHLTELAAGMLITLGFIGTVVGMVGAVSGIDSMVGSVGDGGGGFAGMSDTMRGLKTVFFTTIVGAVIGGLLLRGLHYIYEQATGDLLRQIDEITEVSVIPVLWKHGEYDEDGGKETGHGPSA